MRLLVLGGAGFIGSHLAEALLDGGHDVVVFDRVSADLRNLRNVADKVRYIGGEFGNSDDLARAVAGMEVVVHLVSATLPGTSLESPVFDIEMNVVGSLNLLQQCVRAGVRKVVFVSSGGTVYGIPKEIPIRESHSLDPINPYGVSKMVIEKYLGLYHYQHGLDYTVLRMSNPYGARQNPRTGQGVIAAWLHRVLNGEPIEIWGDGSIVRDYLYIDDAVSALKMAIERDSREKVFNVGSGVGHSLNEIKQLLKSVIGRELHETYKTARRVDVPVNILDPSRIGREFGWAAGVELRDGLENTWRSLQQ